MVSERGTFVGYEPNAKAYRVLRERDGRILASRDVLFDETAQPAKAAASEFELNGRATKQVTAEKEAKAESETGEKSSGTGQGSATEARVTDQQNLGRVTTRTQARPEELNLRGEPDKNQAEADTGASNSALHPRTEGPSTFQRLVNTNRDRKDLNNFP
jgi:hypothetical protein